jgi:hypothetical protein
LPKKRLEVARRRSIHSITLKLSGAPGIEKRTRTEKSEKQERKRGYAKNEKGERAKSKMNISNPSSSPSISPCQCPLPQ